MEVIFLDNGLISKGEHSYALAAKLAEALSRRNLRYRMFGVHSLDRSIAEELGASPHFKRSLYDGEDLSRDEQRLCRDFPGCSGSRPDPVRTENLDLAQ